MPWSWSSIDWNGTGAMVQAIGSVAAILAAVVIDRGSVRRAEVERAARDRQMRADRILAIQYCAAVLRDVGRALEGAAYEPGQPLELADGARRQLDVTRQAIDYYVANAGEVGPEVVGTMIHAQAVLADGQRSLRARPVFNSAAELEAAAKAFRARALDIAEVLAALEGTMRFRARQPGALHDWPAFGQEDGGLGVQPRSSRARAR